MCEAWPTLRCPCERVLVRDRLSEWDDGPYRASLAAYSSPEGVRRRRLAREAENRQARAEVALRAEQERRHELWLRSKERAALIRQELATDQRLRWRVFDLDGYRCRECGRGGGEVDLTIDHIVPVSRGGDNSEQNLRTLCRPCNSRKGARVY